MVVSLGPAAVWERSTMRIRNVWKRRSASRMKAKSSSMVGAVSGRAIRLGRGKSSACLEPSRRNSGRDVMGAAILAATRSSVALWHRYHGRDRNGRGP